MAKVKKIPLSHPGELLYEHFMEPLGISQYRLAKDIGVPLTRIANIVKGKRAITPETALLLAQYFRRSERFFMNLQSHYDLEMAKEAMEKSRRVPVIPFPLPEWHDRAGI